MKQLILVRHGLAVPHESGGRDFNRVLEQAGRREAAKAGAFLKSQPGWMPDRILCSPAARASATAKIVAGELGYDDGMLRKVPSIYEASISDLLEIVHNIEDRDSTVCLVGHNPGLEDFANWLAGSRIIGGLATAGVVMLELRVDEWRTARGGCASLHQYVAPTDS